MEDTHNDDPVVALTRVTKRYVAGVYGCSAVAHALMGVSLTIRRGEAIAVVGPPGAGKSTLLLCAAGLIRPDSGTVEWAGSHDGFGSAPSRSPAVFMDTRLTSYRPARTTLSSGLLVLDSIAEPLEPDWRRRVRRMIDTGRTRGAVLIAGRSEDACRAIVPRAGLSAVVRLVGGRVVPRDQTEFRAPGRVAERVPGAQGVSR